MTTGLVAIVSPVVTQPLPSFFSMSCVHAGESLIHTCGSLGELVMIDWYVSPGFCELTLYDAHTSPRAST